MKTSILVEDGGDPRQLVGPIETKRNRTQGCRPPLVASATHRPIGEGCAFGSCLIIVAQLNEPKSSKITLEEDIVVRIKGYVCKCIIIIAFVVLCLQTSL